MPLLITDGVDWKLDNTTWDLVIPLVRVSGAEGVRQRIGILLRMIRGEWFAGMTSGMPWFKGNGVDAATAILGQAFAEVKTRAEVRKLIMSVPGVAAITKLAVTFDRRARIIHIVWRCTTIWGNVTAEGEFQKQLAAA